MAGWGALGPVPPCPRGTAWERRRLLDRGMVTTLAADEVVTNEVGPVTIGWIGVGQGKRLPGAPATDPGARSSGSP